MHIKRICLYRGPNYNILPAILVTPKVDGFIVAFKWWNFHFGVYVCTKVVDHLTDKYTDTNQKGCSDATDDPS